MKPQKTLTASQPCECCNGLGWIRDDLPETHPDFGQLARCSCVADDVEQRRLDNLFQAAGVPPRYRDLTLDGIPLEHRNRKHLAVAVAEMYMDRRHVVYSHLGEYSKVVASALNHQIPRPDEPRYSILFHGPFGVGKTGILSVVFQHLLKQGMAGIWIEYLDFVKEVQRGYGDGLSGDRLDAAREAPIIMIDDLGASSSRRGNETDDRSGIFYQVINYRHAEDLPTLMTSNLDLKGLGTYFSGRTVARIKEMALVCAVNGLDLRDL